jgi:hypothetical protein
MSCYRTDHAFVIPAIRAEARRGRRTTDDGCYYCTIKTAQISTAKEKEKPPPTRAQG